MPRTAKPDSAPRVHDLTIDSLKPAPYNPSNITPEARAALTESLKRFGDISGIVLNTRTGNLVAGHQRVDALRREFGTAELRTDPDGHATIHAGAHVFPVRVVDWDEATERAANIAANNPHIAGTFDDAKLQAMLEELKDDPEFGDMFDGLAFDQLISESKKQHLKHSTPPRPPSMAWVLIGCPISKFSELTELVETVAADPDILIEQCISDANTNARDANTRNALDTSDTIYSNDTTDADETD